jgi:hypothetical protein
MLCTRCQSRSRKRNRNSGLSLLEVIIATAILAGSGLALFSIIGMGSKYALRAEELTYAQHFAQSALDEWLTAPTNVGTEQTGTFEEAPQWNYRVESQWLEEPGLCAVTVEIFHSQNPQRVEAVEEPIYRFTRWVRVSTANSAGEVIP